MTKLGRAFLDALEPEDLAVLAERLAPYLKSVDDGWLDTQKAAEYAGCTVSALRHATHRGEVEYEQAVDGGKVFFRRSALDRWRMR